MRRSYHDKLFENILRNIGTLQKFSKPMMCENLVCQDRKHAIVPATVGKIYRSAKLLVRATKLKEMISEI